MDPTIDRLIKLRDRTRGEIFLTLWGQQWNPAKSKPEVVQLGTPPESMDSVLWWGSSLGKTVRLVRPAIQLVDMTSPKEWVRIFSQGGVLRANEGSAVLSTTLSGEERWFGPVTLVAFGPNIDPKVIESSAVELKVGEKIGLYTDFRG